MDDKHSKVILQVERAASDLRRGNHVIIKSEQDWLVGAAEYFPELPILTTLPLANNLMKLAGLLPQTVGKPYIPDQHDDYLAVTADAINHYREALSESLRKVSEANVPLIHDEHARIIAFRSPFGHDEHLAILIGQPEKQESPLVRLHSSCITGDVLGSLKCDCGNQLQKAFAEIKKAGHGIILYLNQEGRGIGIANKLRAYRLQEAGMDTVEANHALGFEGDERDFSIAANMLKAMGIFSITLLTNNPEKMKSLAIYGIKVVKRQSLLTLANTHSKGYIDTKALKMGHILGELDE